jgi:tetratricopeptide (TPR) repeat protein
MVFGKSSSSSRPPMDADGHFGGCPPRSVAEPELTVGGKVVLVGSSVVRVNKHHQQQKHQQKYQPKQGTSGSLVTSTKRRDNTADDERDTAPSKSSSQLQLHARDGERETSDESESSGSNEKPSAAASPSSSSWWPWSSPTAAASPTARVEPSRAKTAPLAPPPSSSANDDDELRRPESQKSAASSSSFWGWFGGSNAGDEAAVTSPAPKPPSSYGMFPWSSPRGARDYSTDGSNDDDSAGDDANSTSKLFGDLRSLPSVNGDVTIGGESIRSADFDGDDNSIGRNSVLVDKKLKEITIMRSPSRLGKVAAKKPEVPEASKNQRQLLVKELRAAIAAHGRYDVRCAAISSALGDVLDEAGEYEQSIKLHKDAVTIYSVKLGDHHQHTNDAKLRLASVLANAGQYDDALAAYYAVMAMHRVLKGDKDPAVADGLALMASTLRKAGEYNQAIKELKRALKIYRETLGDSHEKVASTVDAIASLYVTVGDFDKSSAILEEVVKLKAATIGMKSRAVAETLTCLAMTYECSEQYPLAMKALKRAYKIYTEMGGYASEDATATLSKIAMLYEATEDYNRASIAYLGVLRGRKIHHGEDHLLVGETYCKLGHALRETGQLEKALKCMKEALPIYVGKGVEMNDVEKIAEIMHEMALIYKDKKHYSEASRIFKQELSVRRKIGQPEFPHVARILNLLGMTEFELKNNSRALKHLVEALTIFQDQKEHGAECAEVLYNTGLVFSAARNKDRALEAFAEAERLFSESTDPASRQMLINTKREIHKIRETMGGRYK